MAVWSRPNFTNSGLLSNAAQQYTSVSAESRQTVEVTSTDCNDFALRRDIVVSQRDFKLFLVSLEQPKHPSDKLRAAAEEYKRNQR